MKLIRIVMVPPRPILFDMWIWQDFVEEFFDYHFIDRSEYLVVDLGARVTRHLIARSHVCRALTPALTFSETCPTQRAIADVPLNHYDSIETPNLEHSLTSPTSHILCHNNIWEQNLEQNLEIIFKYKNTLTRYQVFLTFVFMLTVCSLVGSFEFSKFHIVPLNNYCSTLLTWKGRYYSLNAN